MAKYILLLHENPANYTDLGPADMQAMIERYSTWGRSIAEAGKMHSGMKLGDNGGWHMRRGGSGWWQGTKIGAGPIPIETKEGWLMFYHGVCGTCNGCV